MDFNKRKLLAVFFVMATSSTIAQEISDSLKTSIDRLNQKNGKESEQLVNDALIRAKSEDLTKINEIINSSTYQNRLESYNTTAREMLGLEAKKDFNPTPAEETNNLGDRLVLFVSSSMPTHVLRNYVNDIDKVGGVMIFKGTIGGIDSLMPTVNLLRNIMAVNPSCTTANCDMKQVYISIDPQRFDHHNITRVPALIYEKDMKVQAYCKEGDQGPKAETVAYGDASLAGLTNAIFQRNQDPALKALLNKLRGTK